jgi:hypothetical protein
MILASCVSTPAPPSPASRLQLGHVGVTALASTPNVEFHTFAKGWAEGAVKGGATGFAEGLVNALTETARHPPAGAFAEPVTLITLVVLATTSAVVYSVVGGMEAVPIEAAEKIEQQLNNAIGDVNLANDLTEQIHHVSVSHPELATYTVTQLGISTPGVTAVYSDWQKQGIDTVVEVQVTDAGFRGGRGANPQVSFFMNTRIRLVAVNSGTEIYTRDFQYLSRERLFEEWFVDGAGALTANFKQALDVLSERIVDELFIVTDFPFTSGLWAFPGQPEFGTCWFQPLYPEIKYTSLWDSMRSKEPGAKIRYTQVDSLQPLLKWEGFPRPRDQTADNAVILNQITHVSYDLKIWEAPNDYPERLVLDVTGLNDPQYQPAVNLKPENKYFWSFRARYQLAGQSQVTRWAFSNIPSNAPDDYPLRPPGGSCEIDAIPADNYFRFVTP